MLQPGKEYEAKVTDVEQKDVQTGAYFTEPTEKTRKIHEKLIQMCMADIDNKTRKFAANNPQVTLQEDATEKKPKKKKYRKRTEEEKRQKREERKRKEEAAKNS